MAVFGPRSPVGLFRIGASASLNPAVSGRRSPVDLDKDRAFELMEKALAVRDDRLLWIKVDPRFDKLRAYERYEGLLRRMNLPK
jgi:hypothetical protein